MTTAPTTDEVATEPLGDLVVELSRPRGVGVFLGRITGPGRFGRFAARLARSPMRARWATTRITRLHARLLRLSRGRLRRSWLFAAGQPVLALTTTGRRSGQDRTTAVAALTYQGQLATVGMNLGSERNPSWSYNLQANPDASIEVKGQTIAVRARLATGDEWEALWNRWLEVQPSAAAFADLAGRKIPIFVLERRSVAAS
jgi:deazaflavin-dependent oxidoreductase (nitroreductase family)